jgi:hypothetical protein
MNPDTKENIKFVSIVIIAFLALKDIPVGDLVGLVATSCGVAP